MFNVQQVQEAIEEDFDEMKLPECSSILCYNATVKQLAKAIVELSLDTKLVNAKRTESNDYRLYFADLTSAEIKKFSAKFPDENVLVMEEYGEKDVALYRNGKEKQI